MTEPGSAFSAEAGRRPSPPGSLPTSEQVSAAVAPIMVMLAKQKSLEAALQHSSSAICRALGAVRMSYFGMGREGKNLSALYLSGIQVKTSLRLPVTAQSVAGYVALTGKSVIAANAYDAADLRSRYPSLRFYDGIDRRTGFKTKQIVALPITDLGLGDQRGKVCGVIELLNHLDDRPFADAEIEGAKAIASAFALIVRRSAGAGFGPAREAVPRKTVESLVRVGASSGPPVPRSPSRPQYPGPTTVMRSVVLADSAHREPANAERALEESLKMVAVSAKPTGAPVAARALPLPLPTAVIERLPLVARPYASLVEMGRLPPERFLALVDEAESNGRSLEEWLLKNGVPAVVIGAALSRHHGIPYASSHELVEVSEDIVSKLKVDYLRGAGWLPIRVTDKVLTVATVVPASLTAAHIDLVISRSGRKIERRVTTSADFKTLLAALFREETPANIALSVDDIVEDDDGQGVTVSDNELVRYVNTMISEAHAQGASDIHIEPQGPRDPVLIRFRKDGSMIRYAEIPPGHASAMAARIKIMCDLDISEKRRPQDGKIKFSRFGRLDIELRVATLPGAQGREHIVMRLLAGGEPVNLDRLGLSEANYTRLVSTIDRPYGLFLVCGPTGSGKTTTLHSVLGHLNRPDSKIWTAEDPVEITQKGLCQVQINRKAGLDFATVMKSLLRADPDIIMVGEMRDKETAAIGVEASLTGHMVFSTLHTNSAPESIVRLLDLGLDAFNFADALVGVLAQRLAKRLCRCAATVPADDEALSQLVEDYATDLQHTVAWQNDPEAARQALIADWRQRYGQAGALSLRKATGCGECDRTGYRGRLGIHELLVATPTIKRLVQQRATVDALVSQGIDEGMRTLKQDGIEKALQGHTDLAQVRAVCIR